MADHLGQVNEKEGNKKEAAHLYLLAIAAAKSNDWGFDVVPTRGRLMKLSGKLAADRSAGQSVDFTHSKGADRGTKPNALDSLCGKK